jgi:hypothetical protein
MNEAFKTVSSGFKLVYAGFLMQVAAVVIGIVAGLIGEVGTGILYLINGLSVAGQIIALFGAFQCMAAPEKVGAKQQITISVVTNTIALVFTLILAANTFTGEGFVSLKTAGLIGIAGTVLSLVSIIMFLLYTKMVAIFVRRGDLAGTAQSVLTLVVVLTVVVISMYALTFAILGAAVAGVGGAGRGAAGAAIVILLLGLVALVLLIIFAIRYANLLSSMGEATLRYAKKGGGDIDEDDDRAGGKAEAEDDWDR